MVMTSPAEPKLLSFTEARQAVEEYASRLSPTEPEMLSLLDAVGLVLAEDLRADRDFPPFPRSTRDGYAVRAADVAAVPARLRLIGEIKAGANSEQSGITIGADETAEIMTGAPVPSGADAVVMVEYTERSGEVVTVQRAAQAGREHRCRWLRRPRQGSVMVARGTRVTHTTVAVAAAVGRAEIAAYRRPRVAILATGDEVVDINLPPGPNEIRNSNSYSLAAQVYAAGGEPLILPVAPDSADELALLLRKGLGADLLLVTGGVSMGKYDLVEQVLASFEARFLFTGVRIQPGKPVVFGDVTLARQDDSVSSAFREIRFRPWSRSNCSPGRCWMRSPARRRNRCRLRKAALKSAVHDQDRDSPASCRQSWAARTSSPKLNSSAGRARET